MASGFSVSLSSDGQILAVGSPFDSNEIGATWIYISNSSIGTYSQSGSKLVGSGSLFPARQGKCKRELFLCINILKGG